MQECARGAHNGQKSVFSGQRNVMCTTIKGVFNGLQFTWIGVIYWVIYPVVSKLDEVVLLCQKMSHYLMFNRAIKVTHSKLLGQNWIAILYKKGRS